MDIRNFGQKSIDEVKAVAVDGPCAQGHPPGFDPAAAVAFYDDNDAAYAEDEQL